MPKNDTTRKMKDFDTLQKLSKNMDDLGKIIAAQSAINCPFWSHWQPVTCDQWKKGAIKLFRTKSRFSCNLQYEKSLFRSLDLHNDAK